MMSQRIFFSYRYLRHQAKDSVLVENGYREKAADHAVTDPSPGRKPRLRFPARSHGPLVRSLTSVW